MNRRQFSLTSLLGAAGVVLGGSKETTGAFAAPARPAPTMTPGQQPIQLSQEHLAAVNRRRRIVVNYDAGDPSLFGIDFKRWLEYRFNFVEEKGSQIDSLWWCHDEGNMAVYPSQVLPLDPSPGLRKWWAAGIDFTRAVLEESRKRGLEAFWSYRINGADREPDGQTPARLPLKQAHPEWLIQSWWPPGLWNFAVKEVREYKLKILGEVAENYDYDGMEIDFARHPPLLPPGHQWENAPHLTEFMRMVRRMLLEVERKRARPFLLAARVPENLEGGRLDGLDLETWARENLVDIFVMGVRSYDVDVAAYRRLTAGKPIKLLACLGDGDASSDGYNNPPLEVFRGVVANWWKQGIDGVQTFNFFNSSPKIAATLSIRPGPASHLQAYQEIGSPQTLEGKDKTFVVQRRGGRGWSTWFKDGYFNSNRFAHLPAALEENGRMVTVPINIADDLSAAGGRLKEASLNILFAGAAAEDKVGVRFNSQCQERVLFADGWWSAPLDPGSVRVGGNNVTLYLIGRGQNPAAPIQVEKVEVRVRYQ